MQTSKQLCCKSRLKAVDMGGSNGKMGRRQLPLASGSHTRQNSQTGWWGQIRAFFSWGTTTSGHPNASGNVATFGSQHVSSEYQRQGKHASDPNENLNDEADISMESVFMEQLKLQQQQQDQHQQHPQGLRPNGRLEHLANRIGGRAAAHDSHPNHGWQHQQDMDAATDAAAAENIPLRRLAVQDQTLLPHLAKQSDAELFQTILKKKQEAMYRETMVEETPAAEKNLRKDLLNRWDNGVERQDPALEDAMAHHHLHRHGSAEDVKKRYGKWSTVLEGIPAFSAVLHQQGARGLQLFGYEPSRLFADNNVPPRLSCPCDETVECSKEDTQLIAPSTSE
jgi:hypothetical protein